MRKVKAKNWNRKIAVNCALCQSNSSLLNSHILPEFFYTQLYDKIHRFQVVPIDPSESERSRQKGVHEKLLCGTCEQKFARWEKYAKEAFGDGSGIKIERNGKILKLSNLNYRMFRLFLLSLLWRMGVSKLDFFSLTNLGSKHHEILRQTLLNEDPLEPLQYPCLMSAVYINGKFHTDCILQSVHNKSGSYHCHCVVINGILFCFYVASHSPPAIFADVCISRKNEMSIFVGEIKEIPFLAEYASNLGKAIRLRRQPEKR
jgi:hypothetical protein